MKVGDSVRKAIDDSILGDSESSMLHACNAVDGTAKKAFPGLGVGERFTKLLRENYSVLGPMGAPGIDLLQTRFPVKVKTKLPDSRPDLADVIYGVHRCSHGHGDELPNGFELLPALDGDTTVTTMKFTNGTAQLSERIIFGLLAVAVLHRVNLGQSVPDGYHLTYGSNAKLEIGEWWGRASDFPGIVALDPPPASIRLDFGDWHN